MTDGNTYAINKHLNEREDFDALQEATTELEQAETRIEELEAKLAKAVTRLQHIAANKTTGELTVIEWDTYDMFTILDACISEARTTLAELKEEAMKEAADLEEIV